MGVFVSHAEEQLRGDAAAYYRLAAESVTASDTTGAGDAFLGSFAHFFASGMEAPEALGQAARYAASSITRRGTQKSYLTEAEFVAF